MTGNEERKGSAAYTPNETIAVVSRSVLRRARRNSDGASVILKSFRSSAPGQREELLRELQRRRQLFEGGGRDDEVCEVGGEPVLVFEDFGGRPLLVPETGLELGLCLELGLRMARALDELHERGLLHDDLKPASFLVELTSRRVEIIDCCHEASDVTNDGKRVFGGSAAYMAPERTGRVNRQPDQRADYYSFGITLFQMLTGRLPFAASDALGWAHAHLSKQAALVSEFDPSIPRVLADFVAKLLAKNPDERYQSGHGLLADLASLAESWAKSHELADFALGARDGARGFEVSRETVGREAELSSLLSTLEHVRAGATRLVLLSGTPGVGKSTLLGEFARRAATGRQWLLQGAFDERAQSVPLSGFAQIFRGLATQLLLRPEVELGEIRRKIVSTLGVNAGLLSSLVPDLVRVIGPQAPVAQLNPVETQHRLQHVVSTFLDMFAEPERPIVLALDDCQWMDGATAEALTAILSNPDVRYVMVLGAFRASELGESSPLSSLRQAVRSRAPGNLLSVELGTLAVEAVNQLLARTLRTSLGDVAELAQTVRQKTDGNPFFIGQLLDSLHRQGIVTRDREQGRFRHDLERVRACQVADNVGALMAEQLEHLGRSARDLLSRAACFGSRFELGLLAHIVGLEPSACRELLEEAVSARLLISAAAERGAQDAAEPPGSHAFEHARVQQAALARLSAAERVELHGKIGRHLRQRASHDEPTQIFEVLRHLNQAREGLREPRERVELANLNLDAALLALQSAAANIAEAHSQTAVELVGEAEQALAPDLAFRALLIRAESAFLAADGARAETWCARLFELAPDQLARGRVHVLKTRLLEHQGRMQEAVVQIRGAVAEFGVRLPESPDEIGQGIGEGIGKMQGHLARVPVEALAELPVAESAETKMILSLLEQVIPPAFQTYPPLFILVELMMFDLALSRGISVASCKNFADCGIIQIAILGDYDVAYRLGLAALSLIERFAPTPVEAGVNFVFAGFLSHWKRRYDECFAVYDRAEQSGLALGDLPHASYAKNDRAARAFLVGVKLSECRDRVAQARTLLTRVSARAQLVGTFVAERVVARLMASEAEQEEVARADAEAKAAIIAEGSAQYGYAYGQAQLMTCFIMRDFEAARDWQVFASKYILAAAGQFSLPDYHLFDALLALRSYASAEGEARAAALATVDENLQKLELWGNTCPENFVHKYHFLCAERALALGEPLQVVLGSYRRTVSTAGDGFVHLRALAFEQQAALWLSLDETLHARTALHVAYRLYEGWGAIAKLAQLERQYPDLLADTANRDSLFGVSEAGLGSGGRRHGLDEASVLKATQSIFSEVEPQKLFSALMATLIENAGAQHGCLILRDDDDGQFYVEARASVDLLGAGPSRREPYGNAESLCTSAVQYVLRSGETLTLDDASARGAFQADPDVAQRRVRSLLCTPIVRQGETLGVLYIENNLTSHAFTRERLAVLQVIASQAAISIYNAQLYERLERRVADRTRELALKNSQIASMLDNLELGIFTIDQTLRVQPGYSRHLAQILGTPAILGRDCVELLFAGSSLRLDAVSAAESALRFSFDAEPWLAELNAPHLITEMQRVSEDGEPRFLEFAWNMIAGESGRVDRILVTARDVTLVLRLKQAAREKAREVDIIVQALDCGVDILNDFCGFGRKLLAENRAALASGAAMSEESVAAAFRNLHTLKGNARLRGFTHLVEGLHVAEEAYDQLRQTPELPVDGAALSAQLDAVDALINEYTEVCRRKLAPVVKNRDDEAERALEEISAIVTAAAAVDGNSGLVLSIRESLSKREGTSLASLVEEAKPLLPSLAVELGKPAPSVHTDVGEARLQAPWTDLFRELLVQCFRNSLYHGLEEPERRLSLGKPAAGRIEIRVRRTSGAFELQLFDDGRGLALEKLRRRLADPALDAEGLAQRIFQPGLSTAEQVSHVAGRGVGLDIVRSNLRARGGDAFVRFTAEEQRGYRPFVLVLVLPASAFVGRFTSGSAGLGEAGSPGSARGLRRTSSPPTA